MKHLPLALLLGLAARPALAGPPPTVPANLDALGLHLTLDAEAQQLVQAKVNSLCRHQASLDERVALAEAAFPVIDQALAQEGVPTDFRYLVLQESALQGNAESPHGAVGYWQLKRETAQGLGLTVNNQVDERRHLAASTHAAARYLARNNAPLRNWASALLSYNLGPTGAKAYIDPADADATSLALTARSSPYLLDFVAQKLVFEPACAASTVPFVAWREVAATPGQSLTQHAATLGTDPATLARLNPWLLAATVPDDGRTYTLLAPLVASAPVVAAVPTPLPATLPPAPASPRPVAPAPAPALPPNLCVIAPHETLYGIARRQRLRPADLAAWNGLAPTASLQIGQLLRLDAPAPDALPLTGTYVVAAGDTFYSISRRYRCTVADLQAHNDHNTLALQVGEVLRVPRY